MIRSFKFEIGRNIKNIFISACMIMMLILFTYSDTISLINQYGKFKYGEWINILLNDTYTSIYGFSFVLLYFLISWNKKDENEMYILLRNKNRNRYYIKKYIRNILMIIAFMFWIIVCGFMIELFCGKMQNEMSITFQEYCKIYGYKIQKYIFLDNVILYFVLLITIMNFYFFLYDRLRSIPCVLCICGGGIFLLGATTLGAFGETLRNLSIFTLGRGFEVTNLSFSKRIGIFFVLNSMLVIVNFIGFQRRELQYAKGNKQYQIE